ncbi:unnamed protein product [Prorocentrum cordatum]|uniref:Pentacotripeptide-repeat region of PRORP domain-containing protein n=1 Tax=Prorocentrum cordatum TaxID=2364126 RepID=A0ABN9WDL2_9DINO|nr:unnamed protein product [Polarella glacialis]
MIDRGVQPNVFSFNAVLAACAESEDLASAERWFGRMERAMLPPDAVSFRTMVGACARTGKAGAAKAWLARMLAASFALDVVAGSSAVAACAASSDPGGAEGWLRRMEQAGLKVGRAGYDPVARAWAAGGQGVPPSPLRAEGWLWKALEAGVEPTDAALLATLAAFARADDAEGAQRVADLMRRLGRWPSPAATAALAAPHAGAGEFWRVEELVEDLRRDGGKPDAGCLRALLAAYARAPEPPRDGRAEACFRQLLALDAGAAGSWSEALGDLRRALGRQRYAGAAAALSLPSHPRIRRQDHARGRVVGASEVIGPCAERPSGSAGRSP